MAKPGGGLRERGALFPSYFANEGPKMFLVSNIFTPPPPPLLSDCVVRSCSGINSLTVPVPNHSRSEAVGTAECAFQLDILSVQLSPFYLFPQILLLQEMLFPEIITPVE